MPSQYQVIYAQLKFDVGISINVTANLNISGVHTPATLINKGI